MIQDRPQRPFGPQHSFPTLSSVAPGRGPLSEYANPTGLCLPSPILQSFGGTTEIQKEIIASGLGL